MTTLEHATIDGRAHTFVDGPDVSGYCEETENGWKMELTVTSKAAHRLADTMPQCVMFEPLWPGYYRLSGMLCGQSITNALTYVAKLN